jgi:electron transport complex protein RnfB
MPALDESLVRRIEDALPQTQCTRCGYPDCHAYAQAIAQGQAGIHQCPRAARKAWPVWPA